MKICRRIPFAVALPLLLAHACGASCGSVSDLSQGAAPTTPDASIDADVVLDAGSCGNSRCESTLWPRLAIVFGTPAATKLSYTFATQSRTSTMAVGSSNPGFCPSGYGESSAYHCDIGFDASRDDTSVRVSVDGFPDVSSTVLLAPYNYCGNGMAELSVYADSASVSFGPVRYVNVCGL